MIDCGKSLTIDDIKNAINRYSGEKLWDLCMVFSIHRNDEEIFQKVNYEFVKRLKIKDKRIYMHETNVYRFTEKNGNFIGYLAIEELGILKQKIPNNTYLTFDGILAYNVNIVIESKFDVIYD